VLDQTVTAMGTRMLKRWVQQPLLDLEQIHARLDAVDELVRDAFLREDVRKLLDGLYDVERLVGRIGFGNANARDLIALKRALVRLPQIKTRLLGDEGAGAGTGAGTGAVTAPLRELGNNLDELQDVFALIDAALVDDPPIFVREGGLVKRGYDPALDELRESATRGKRWLSDLEEQERQRTGIKNLRVRYNEVFGFFIEVPRSAAKLVPADYERRATITHAERYVTPELKTQEAHILATQDRIKDLEYDLFVQVRSEVARHAARLQSAARILAQLDALCALAHAAARHGYTKPVVDDSDVIEIREGRHPVVERFLPEGESFVPNDVRLDHESQRVLILTGPNMSGKSVFVRQVALIVLMAHIGSFVPASFARIGLTDRIFTRAGASDDIAQGRSTFLVEMSETSHILRHATPRSLIVLDEVGRGTSTYDGISLAWAIAEEIHNITGAKTLFATHYHELTRLEEALGAAVKNYTMAVHERGGEVVFLRQVIPGSAEKSFGIHVARLAGLPSRVIGRAEEVLQGLEESREPREISNVNPPKRRGAGYQISKEERDVYDARIETWRSILQQLMAVDIANMTPLQALNLLNEIQMMVKESGSRVAG
jgi:DNA mismatch repair protein MutS